MNAKERYQRLHEGLAADSVSSIDYHAPTGVRPDGAIKTIYYSKPTTNGDESFFHDYAPASAQRIGRDSEGNLAFFAGRSVVTTRGIEDLPPALQGEDRLPTAPTTLTALGKLDRVVYHRIQGRETESAGRRGKAKTESFGHPTLAHDEHGNLHALYLPKTTSSKGSRPTMMRKRNPVTGTLSMKESAVLMLQTAAVVGTMSVVSARTLNMAINSWAPTWDGNMRAGAKIAGGLAGGFLLSMLTAYTGSLPMQIVVAQIASGWAVGGFAAGIGEIYDMHVAPQIASLMAPAQPAPQAPPQAPPVTAPPARAYMPAGQSMPSGYTVQNQATCGVRR